MYKLLIRVLEQSVQNKGEVPLTNLHLLNILKLADKLEAKYRTKRGELEEQNHIAALEAAYGEHGQG